MAYAWQTAKPGSYYATDSVAKRKYGAYEPDKYEYIWDGAYLNRQAKATNPSVLETPEQKQAKATLAGLMNNTPAYTGQLTAKNQYSDQIKASLSDYLNAQQPESLASAEKVLQDTLTGTGYDPNTSQYYQGVRQAADLNLADALNRYNRGSFLKGNLRSTATDFGRARLLAENTAGLNQTLGTLALQERQNQLNAVNQAQTLADYLSGQKLNRLNAVQNTSQFLTAQDQAALDAKYQEWLRQQQQKSSLAQYLYSTPVTYVY